MSGPRTPRVPILAAAALFLAALGCEGAPAWPPEPAPIALAEDACAACRMIVTDESFAAQRRTREGESAFYDDLGCLIEDARARGADPEGIFVRPYAGGDAWVRGDRAWVVRAKGITSPMGSGLAAFAAAADAEAEARRREGARAMKLVDMLVELAKR